MADAELLAHREWLGYVQPVGVVVSPPALIAGQAYVNRNVAPLQGLLLDVIEDSPATGPTVTDLPKLLCHVLRWQPEDLVEAVPAELERALPEYGQVLRPTYAVREVEPEDGFSSWVMLIDVVGAGADFDAPLVEHGRGWGASPHAKFERLLRETQIPIGLLCNGTNLRLVYAPRGETSGYLTFPVAAMTEVTGRPVLAALDMLLGAERLFALPLQQRLPALLAESRRYQNDVSTRLAGQVLAALYELLRGFQAADDHSHGDLLRDVLRSDPDHVYEGLLTVLLRLVFLLYAEDRDLMPSEDVYTVNYSVGGMFDRLRSDAGRHPDTMDLRYGAWAQLLSLFRMVYDGAGYGTLHLPPRHGHLFNPDRYTFLEGRTHALPRVMGDTVDVPLVSDGVVWRVLQNLLVLDGERLSYRSLDVEQIGSVYETMMGFRLEIARGHAIAVRPAKPHGPPVTVSLEELLDIGATKRSQWLRERTDRKLTDKESSAIAAAASIDEVVAALERKVDRRATPNVVPPGAMVLQPSEERRRTGSHYTPRSLTEPIVRTTLRPILDRLGQNPTPQAILSLKVCDPAMGSGAFLVEACRQLAEALVDAWHAHENVPHIPPDSDELLHARRLVAQRCLYGVDRNPIAVDLAKLSLWLATLARDHAFMFLDQALRFGDSLVGLTREQITAFHWEPTAQQQLIRDYIAKRVNEAARLRAEIQGAADDVPEDNLRFILKDADEALDDVRLIGDLIVSAFFSGTTGRHRREARDTLADRVQKWLSAGQGWDGLHRNTDDLRESRRVFPFHWDIEFPEVFDRDNPGFDGVVGNPPFLGGTRISNVLGMPYFQWLTQNYPPAGHLCDMVAFFFRRAFESLCRNGTLGFVATNTVAQGDTRNGGLAHICAHEQGTIYAAKRRYRWPGNVSVVVSVVHLIKGPYEGPRFLDGEPVNQITAFLFHSGGHQDPARLLGRNELFSAGSKIYGQGFLFEDDDEKASPLSEMRRICRAEPAAQARIHPYLGGNELNQSPTQSYCRYVIDLNDIQDEDGLAAWPLLADIVRRKVKPGRDSLGGNPNNVPLKRRWWAYQAHRPSLYARMAKLDRVLVCSQVTPHVAFAFQPSNLVFSQKLIVFLLPKSSQFATLQSRVHEIWARFFSSTSMDLLSYTPSDCFETFPVPENWETHAKLEAAGRAYYELRAAMMVKNNEGLTKTYNRFHDPSERSAEIASLRDVHGAMDRAVLEAYGWNDLHPTCEFLLDYEEDEGSENGGRRRKPWRYRWPDDIRDEVLARLLALNAERADAERLDAPAEHGVGLGRRPRRPATTSSDQLLLGED